MASISSQPAGLFRVQLLGDLAVSFNGNPLPIEDWQARARTLFTIIAVSPSLRRSRDELIEFMWPEAMPEAGSSNVRYTVHLLRRLLGGLDPSPVEAPAGWVRLNSAYRWEVDLHRFEALAMMADDAALQEAARLFRGEPLPDHRYEDWAVPVRDRARRAWRTVCLRLAEHSIESGRPGDSVQYYERLLDADSLDEEVVQGLLMTLMRVGRRTDALRQYRQFEARLRAELECEPAPETAALVASQMHMAPERGPGAEIATPGPRSQDVSPSYPLPRTGRLVGREQYLQKVRSVLDGTGNGGSPRLLLVSAEAGMGKTRFLAESAFLGREQGLLVLAGGCYEEEGRLPWGPIHDALLDYVRVQPNAVLQQCFGHLLPALAQVVPELRSRFPIPAEETSEDADAQRLRLFSGLSQVLACIATDQKLVLILDDLHWADDVTLQVLHFLLRQPGLERVVLLGAFRAEEVTPESALGGLIARTRAGDRAALLSLQPLSSDETGIVLEERLAGRCAEGVVSTVHTRSGGNPFFAVQIARLLEQEGGIHREHGRWTLTPGAKAELPPEVRETVSRRLRHISIEGRAVLGFGALLGREFPYAALEKVAERSEDALFEALDEAQEAGLLRETLEGYAFAHPLLWEVVYGRMPDQRRQRLHERIGTVLEATYGDDANGHAAELAWHFSEAGKRERALQYVLRAAEQARTSVAYAEAERYYRQAIELANTVGHYLVMAQALEGLGTVLRATRRLEDAILCLDEAARVHESSGDLDAEAAALAELGLCRYFAKRDWSETITRLRGLMERLQSRDGAHPSTALARLAAVLPRLYEESPDKELRAARYALELGETLNDPGVQGAAFLRQGTALIALRRHKEALPVLDNAIRLARGRGDLFTLGAACTFARRAAIRSGLGARALEYGREAFDAVERRGGLEQLRGISDGCFATAFCIGEWHEARTFIEREIALHHQLRGGSVQPEATLSLAWLGTCEGKWDEVAHYLALAEERVEDGSRDQLRVVRVARALLQGDVGEAIVQARLLPAFDGIDWDFEAVRVLALKTGGDPDAIGHASRLHAATRSAHDVTGTGESAYVLAVCLRAAGRTEEAVALLGEAVEIAKRVPMPYLEARALLEWGLLLAAAGLNLEAGTKLTAARAIFHRLNAGPLEQMTIEALRA